MASRGQNHGKGKNKLAYAPKPKIPPPPKREDPTKDLICHKCGETGHWKRNCPQYLAKLLKKKKNAFSRAGGSGFKGRAKLDLDSALLWHCRLGHISKKRIEKLQHDGLLNSTELKAFVKCVSCMSGKMARKPYTHQLEKAKDLLGLIHTDDYSLETAACILNMVPTKKVEKTPYKVWHGQAPKLSYLKMWGCEVLVKRDTLTKPNKLEPISIKCIFIGYPKETMGYSFYYPPENKVLVARNAKFLENSFISQEASGSLKDLEIIQEEDMHPSIDNSLNHEEDDQEIDEPQSDINPIRRFTRARRPTYRMYLYIDAEEHELGDLSEPANYKAALLDHESNKWLNTMNMEMQSMKDNEVWVLVELPPNGKIVVAAIRAIRILIAIAAYYDYEIWQMDVKIALLNGYLSEEVYMVQPKASGSNITFLILYVDDILIMGNNIPMLQDVKSYFGRCFAMKDLGEAAYILGIKIYRDRSWRLIGLNQSAYIKKILKRYYKENSKRGSIPMQEKLRLSKSQGASTPVELKRMQNVPYASTVGSVMYVVRRTHPDVAFAKNVTSRFQQNSGDLHWTTVKNILMYLRNTKDMFLVYEGGLKRELMVSCYTDVGYLTDTDYLKSQTGYVFVLNGGVVDWKSAKQNIFATSSAEAEYITAFDAFKEAVWVRKFISGLGVVLTIEEPISMYCDNTGAIAIANESGITKGARHFHAKVHYLREVIEYGDVKLEKFTHMTT
nr:hypothetical protein [Tanacetum cinerariifolium]